MTRILAVATLPLALAVACSGPEEELVNRFFEATERGDNQTVAALSMVAFPEDVESWNVLEISEERRETYVVPDLTAKVEAAEDERDAQFKVFGEFRQSNYETLRRIQARLREEPDYRFTGRLGELQDEWDAFSEGRREVVAKLRDAELELEREIRRVNKSLQRESSPEYLTGETLRKEALVRVTSASGDTRYQVALTRYALQNQFDAAVPTRWIVTAIEPQS